MGLGADGHIPAPPELTAWNDILSGEDFYNLGGVRPGHPTREEVIPYLKEQAVYWKARYEKDKYYYSWYSETLYKCRRCGIEPGELGLTEAEFIDLVPQWEARRFWKWSFCS